MKKMALGVSMVLAGLVFLVSPAVAASPAQGVPSLSAFLSSLAPAPVTVAKRPHAPAVGEKSLCAAAANCVGGGTVSCSSNTSTSSCTAVDYNCSVGEPGHVTCDGVTTWCTNTCPTCPADWCTGEDACASNCYPCPYTYSCNETYCTDHCRCNFSQCAP